MRPRAAGATTEAVPRPRRPFWPVVAALALACLVALGGAAVGLVLAADWLDRDPAPAIRPASPEEVAAATGTGASADGGQPAGAAPAFERVAEDGPTMEEPAGAGEVSPPDGAAAASPDPLSPRYPAPVVAEEPVVAVAEALGPSVVLVEVGSGDAFEFGLGSGIVWDAANGYVVTNQHVVEGADRVTVTLSDGTSIEGEVVGGSTAHDVAVVKVDPVAADLVAAPFAPTSSVRVGQLAVAIGSPLGLTGTVTAGIVSAVRIQVSDPRSQVPVEMIQTDAAINRGNSGGALADWQGRVIGMNTLIHTTSGGSIGLGFAVPSDTVDLIATRIVRGESLELGYLGISGEGGEGGDLGVVVSEVVAGSPADRAGLMVGDVIVSLDSEPMYDIFELSAAIKLRTPGQAVELTIKRDGDLYVATAILEALG